MKISGFIRMFVCLLLGACVSSCGKWYRMTTTIHKDGGCLREVYVKADSLEVLSGFERVFSFKPYGWRLSSLYPKQNFDFFGEQHELSTKASRELKQVGDPCFMLSRDKAYLKTLFSPTEQLDKSFRWFYTYYIYKVKFPQFKMLELIPLDRYLSREEQQMWFINNKTGTAMNGIELSDKLHQIEDRFWKWFNRNSFEFSYRLLARYADKTLQTQMQQLKEKVYKAHYESEDVLDYKPSDMAAFFDKAGYTSAFRTLYKRFSLPINSDYHHYSEMVEAVAGTSICFETHMPGQLVHADSSAIIRNDGTAIWKVDFYRAILGDYSLQVESRVPNYWAFVLTGLLVIGLLVVCYRAVRTHSRLSKS